MAVWLSNLFRHTLKCNKFWYISFALFYLSIFHYLLFSPFSQSTCCGQKQRGSTHELVNTFSRASTPPTRVCNFLLIHLRLSDCTFTEPATSGMHGTACNLQHAPCNCATLTLHHYKLPRVHHLSSDNCKRKPQPPISDKRIDIQTSYIVVPQQRWRPNFLAAARCICRDFFGFSAKSAAKNWHALLLSDARLCAALIILTFVATVLLPLSCAQREVFAFWSSTFQSAELFPRKV